MLHEGRTWVSRAHRCILRIKHSARHLAGTQEMFVEWTKDLLLPTEHSLGSCTWYTLSNPWTIPLFVPYAPLCDFWKICSLVLLDLSSSYLLIMPQLRSQNTFPVTHTQFPQGEWGSPLQTTESTPCITLSFDSFYFVITCCAYLQFYTSGTCWSPRLYSSFCPPSQENICSTWDTNMFLNK